MPAIIQAERNKLILRKYIPEAAVNVISGWIYKYNFKLKVKKPRSSREGDYTSPHSGRNHTITINRDLNKYAFLITLVHEVAHLVTWEKHKGRVSPHGPEWKSAYADLLRLFIHHGEKSENACAVFPEDLGAALRKHCQRPVAASCSDLRLSRVLSRFNEGAGTLSLERIAAGSAFRIASSRGRRSKDVFIKGEKRRTRFKCVHAVTKREYLVHALCTVEIV